MFFTYFPSTKKRASHRSAKFLEMGFLNPADGILPESHGAAIARRRPRRRCPNSQTAGPSPHRRCFGEVNIIQHRKPQTFTLRGISFGRLSGRLPSYEVLRRFIHCRVHVRDLSKQRRVENYFLAILSMCFFFCINKIFSGCCS